MSYLLPHLTNGWEVDQAIVTEEDRVVVIRFGRDADPTCMVQDEILANIAEKVKNFAVIYVVDIDQVPDFNAMYELYDPCTTMFFYRNKHIMVGKSIDSLFRIQSMQKLSLLLILLVVCFSPSRRTTTN